MLETLSSPTPPPPSIELLALVTPVFLHMFFILAWFCIQPRSTVLHVFLILQKNLAMFFKFKFYFVHGNNLNLPSVEHGTNHLGTEKVCFSFYFNNFHSQNVKPCRRTTRFSALHCQDKKGRLTVLDLGARGRWGGGMVFSILPIQVL